MNDTVIVLFVYKRINHTRKVLTALRDNDNSSNFDLIVFSDAAKLERDKLAVSNVRELCRNFGGFKSSTLICRDKNLGLSESVLSGIDEVFNVYNKVIVLEDDLVPSDYFLEFMSQALEMFENDTRVGSISGYQYPIENKFEKPFFLRGADCWGWATWRDRWINFERSGELLLSRLDSSPDRELFDYNGAYPYKKMLFDRVKGKNDSWAILWHAHNWLESKLILYPNHSLIDNIGNDNSGENSGLGSLFDIELHQHMITLSPALNVVESIEGRKSLELFFRKNRKELKNFWAMLRSNQQFTKYWKALKRLMPDWMVLLMQRIVFKKSASN